MSRLGRWSYKSKVKVKPFISRDNFDGESTYGVEYEILCSFDGAIELKHDELGNEYVSKAVLWTEDQRPKPLDLVQLPTATVMHAIKSVSPHDTMMFGDPMYDIRITL